MANNSGKTPWDEINLESRIPNGTHPLLCDTWKWEYYLHILLNMFQINNFRKSLLAEQPRLQFYHFVSSCESKWRIVGMMLPHMPPYSSCTGSPPAAANVHFWHYTPAYNLDVKYKTVWALRLQLRYICREYKIHVAWPYWQWLLIMQHFSASLNIKQK